MPRRALAELHRCLTPAGLLIAQTPYSSRLKGTFEVEGTFTPEFARKFYGQEDHVRLFGADIASHFRASFFKASCCSTTPRMSPNVNTAHWGWTHLSRCSRSGSRVHLPCTAPPGTSHDADHDADSCLQQGLPRRAVYRAVCSQRFQNFSVILSDDSPYAEFTTMIRGGHFDALTAQLEPAGAAQSAERAPEPPGAARSLGRQDAAGALSP